MKIVIHIDGKRVDVPEKVSLSLTYRNNAFVSADKISSSYSNTITLPRTARNEAVFGCIVSPSSVTKLPYQYLPATIELDSVMVVKDGIAYITEVTASEYKVALVWDTVAQLAKLIEDEKSINELDYEAANNAEFVVWNQANVNSFPSRFPSADYGLKRADGTMPTEAVNHPAVSIAEVLERICNQYGIVPPPDEDVAMMEKWRIPLINRIDPIIKNSAYGYLNNFLQWTGECLNAYYYGSWVWLGLKRDKGYNGEFGLPADDIVSRNLYGATRLEDQSCTDAFIPLVDNLKMKLTGHFRVKLKEGVAVTRERLLNTHLQVVASINGDFKIIADIEPYEMRMNVDGVGGWLRYKFEEVETEKLPSPLPEHPNPALIGLKDCTIFLALSDGVNFIEEGTNTSDNNIYIEQHIEKVNIGGDYYIVPNLPSIKCIDFLKSLATLTGRFITMEDRKMRLYSYDKFNEKADAYDWSDFVVGEPMQTMKFTHGDWARANIFRYKNEEDSAYFSLHNAILDAENEVQVPFTTAPIKEFRSYIPLYEYEDGSLEPKYNDGGEEAYLCVASNDYDKLIRSPKMVELIGNYDILRVFLAEVKVVSVKVALPMPICANIDMKKPVYLQQMGSYFAILELKVKSNGVAELELLKI